ncbi:hypothetical protein SAMN05216228_10845 [Rhizobium tibeticum]|uniref:Uncharacterized protein n=2 Tax=Rhizobium TaxID=379 RepID=A0A1H8WXQ9_9HYPH|nr:hypothetical protein [Rhizobium mongolense]SEI21668.1 hypothetical protein RTCCBAU85039_6701 [Rhizobium tibeticum]SEP32283.1 hypothetical protein SAMN05216228_10845 [Rhizobium tibeticum]
MHPPIGVIVGPRDLQGQKPAASRLHAGTP